MENHVAHEQALAQRLSEAVARRHWPPEALAQASGVPAETVTRHLRGEEMPAVQTAQVYAGVLGLDAEGILAECALAGAPDTEGRPSLLAARQLLEEMWADAPPADQRRIVEVLLRLQDDLRPRETG
jgi:transcriptional regulator with XRE-family HTH domain